MSRVSHCPPGQEFVTSRAGRRIPAHTPKLKAGCHCKSCQLRQWWTAERRAERAEMLRRQYADGTRKRNPDPNRGRVSLWRPQESAALSKLVGQVDLPTMIDELERITKYRRSPAAIKHQIARLGLSRLAARGLSTTDVGRIFGISRETVRTRLLKRGLLVGRPYRGGQAGIMTVFDRAELVAFVREHPEAYDASLINDRELRALAEAVGRGRRLMGTSEVERLTGVNYRQLAAWYAAGLVPTARRVEGVRRGRFGTWLIEAGDLTTVQRLRADHIDRQRRRAEACPSGHPRVPQNLYIEPSSGHRKCRPCRLVRKAS
jgi:hypothetical protein